MENKKIRILMVLGNTRMGGAQAFILNVLRNIDLSKFQIDLAVNFFAESDGIEDECRKYGCNFHIVPYFKVYNLFSYKKAWKKFFDKHHYDIVYAHSTNSASIFLKIAKEYGMKTISHSHSAGFRGGFLEKLAKKFFVKNVGKVSDYWFGCSDIAAVRLYGSNYRQYPHYYDIPNAIDVPKYLYNAEIRNKLRKDLGVSENTLLLGHAGTFTSPKNHIFLVDILKEAVAQNPDTKLICCGAGALMSSVKEHARELGILENILFPGVISNVNEYMMAMDAFVFPSLFEGFPVAILEAQASGLPIYMSDVITKDVDLSDLIHRHSLTENATEWASAILRNKANQNRTEYNKLLLDGKYNIRTTIKEFEKLYSNLVNE